MQADHIQIREFHNLIYNGGPLRRYGIVRPNTDYQHSFGPLNHVYKCLI
jgi:hypothetical protein